MKILIELLIIFCLATSFLIIVFFFIVVINDFKINSWLRKNRPEKFEELSSIGKSGPGFINPRKGYKYIYSNEDDDNIEILKLKISYRKKSKVLKYTIITLIISIGVLFFTVFIVK